MLEALYEAWLSKQSLSSTELSVVLDYSIRAQDTKLFSQVLSQRELTQAHVDKARTVRGTRMAGTWLTSRRATLEDLRETLSITPQSELAELLRIFRGRRRTPELGQLELFWNATTDHEVRLGVLSSLDWTHREIPVSWSRWLLSRDTFGSDAAHRTALQTVTQDSYEWVWGEVCKGRKRIELVCWVFSAVPAESLRHWDVERLVERTSLRLDKEAALGTVSGEALTEAFESISELSVRIWEGTKARDVLARLMPRLDPVLVERLAVAFSLEETARRILTRSEILEHLASSESVLEEAVTSALGDGNGGELWVMVMSHPGLTPHQAMALVVGMNGYQQHRLITKVLAGKSDQFLTELVALTWNRYNVDDRVNEAILRCMSWGAQGVLLATMVGNDARHLELLVKRNITHSAAYDAVKVTEIHRLSSEVLSLLVRHARYTLSDVPGAWEVFETLAQEATTGTFGEMLAGVRELGH